MEMASTLGVDAARHRRRCTSTELLTSVGDVAGRPLLDEVERVTASCIQEHGGTIVKAMGDGLLTIVSLAHVGQLVCMIVIHRAFVHNPMGVRVAVHVGEVAEHDGDILGAAVHVVAWLASVTQGGQIVVSDVVKHKSAVARHPCGDHAQGSSDQELQGHPDADAAARGRLG